MWPAIACLRVLRCSSQGLYKCGCQDEHPMAVLGVAALWLQSRATICSKFEGMSTVQTCVSPAPACR